MAWKRNEDEAPPEFPARGAREPSPPPDRPPARLGPSVTIRGDLTGEEDLLVEGQLQGEVVVRQHSVTVGRSGRVEADVYGKRVVVEGEVTGNLYGVEEVVIRQAGSVKGSAVSPRVTIESGASFRGQIDMQSESVKQAFSRWEAGPPEPQRRAEGQPGSSAAAVSPSPADSQAKPTPKAPSRKAAGADG
jgi:cytoskeletal protein CcmA (bactofilin family)